MKIKFALPLIAVLAILAVTVGTSAFKSASQSNLDPLWYEYTSSADPFVNNNILDPDNYELTSNASEIEPCDADDVFCAIRALPGGSGKADISGTSGLQAALSAYVANQNNRDEDFIVEQPE